MTKKILKEIYPYVIIVLLVVLIRSFVITPVQVDGESMMPTLKNNEVLLLKKYDHSFKRFDIIVFDYRGQRLIKRIVGLPGESVEYRNNKLYINGKRIKETFVRNSETADFKLEDIDLEKVPKNTYFVMGDNRNNSTDSRIIGVVRDDMIKGSTNFSIFPFNDFGLIK